METFEVKVVHPRRGSLVVSAVCKTDALLQAGLVDKVYAFIAPKIIGGRDALTPVEGVGRERLADAVQLTGLTAETIGEDILLTGYVRK